MRWNVSSDFIAATREKLRRITSLWVETLAEIDAENGRADGEAVKRYHQTYGLGVPFRCKIVHILSETGEAAMAQACKLTENQLLPLIQPNSKRAFAHGNVGNIVAFANARLRAGKPEIAQADFECTQFFGPAAPEAFAFWLIGARALRDGEDFLPTEKACPWISTPEREEIVEKTLAFIRDEDAAPILNVHQSGMERGLTAFAGRLARLLEGEDADRDSERMPYCYLPAGRRPDGARTTPAQLLAWLIAFYEGRSLRNEPPVKPDGIAQAILELRAHVSRTPALIIFDGHISVGADIASLRGLVLDDAVHALLPHLMFPRIEAAGEPEDPAAFYRTRLLILSDRKVGGLEPFDIAEHVLPYPPNETMPDLLDELPFAHVSALKHVAGRTAVFCSTVALSLFDAIVGQICADPAFDARALADALAAHDEPALTRRLAGELRARNPADLLALRFIALAGDGMRCATLERVLALWKIATVESDPDHLRVAPQSFDSLAALAERYPSLVVAGEVEETPGIGGAPRSLLGEEAPAPRDAAHRFSLDLRSREIREALVRNIVEQEADIHVCRMHRILSEEALQQQTWVMRHVDPAQIGDPRTYRRFFQALVHGFVSLARGPGATDPGIGALPRILPKDPAGAFERLYTVFHRQIAEAPPRWELSRTFGRERLKADLLIVAVNADQMREHGDFPYRRQDPLNPRLPIYLTPNGVRDERKHRIAVDLMSGLAHALYHCGDIKRAEIAIDHGREALKALERRAAGAPALATNSGASEATFDQRLFFLRTEIDILLLKDPSVRPSQRIREALRDIGFREEGFARLTSLRDEVRDASSEESLKETILKGALDLAELYPEFDARERTACADLLSRYGEAVAQRADVERSESEAVSEFVLAFLAFRVGDQLRRSAYDLDPLGRLYVASGHNIRTYARVALKIAKSLDDAFGASGRSWFASQPSPRYFQRQASRQADILTRHHFRYASERASIFVLESTFDRLVMKDLAAAQRSLARADAFVGAALERPRVRMRLMLERVKVLRERADDALRRRSRSDAERLLRSALLDAERVRGLARHFQHPYWIRLAEKQVTLCDKVLRLCRPGRPG